MDFRTIVEAEPSGDKISHTTPVMFIGSCFAAEIGQRAGAGKIPVLVNPYGTLFNPFSVSDALVRFSEGYNYSANDLYFYNNRFYSLSHYTAFSSDDADRLIVSLNKSNKEAAEFLKKASFLFITFGTAWLFELKETGRCVANCHKLPAQLFTKRQADVEEIVEKWMNTLDVIMNVNPSVRVFFTVSPVRHMNDGAHGNQLSKARLLLSVESLMKHRLSAGYFPAYEIFNDDLRDYRYYASDMLHPSETGIDYVWEKFTGSFFDKSTLELWTEAEKINRAMQHRLIGHGRETKQFALNMLGKIEALNKKSPLLDMQKETDYFRLLV